MSTISDKNYQTTHDLPLPQFQIWSREYREASSVKSNNEMGRGG